MMSQKIITILILLIAPLITLLWHYNNTQYPMSDAVGFIESASIIVKNLYSINILEFVVSVFNERGWRPIIFQLFIVPFLFISNMDILLATMLTHTFFSCLSVFIIFKILKKYNGHYVAAILTTVLCLSNEIMFGGESFPLYAEIAFIPFLLISIYLLLSDEIFFDKKKSTFLAIALSTLIMIRPVEGIIYIIFPLLITIFYRYSNINYSDKIKCLIIPVFTVMVLFVSRLIPSISNSIIKIDPPHSLKIYILLTIFIIITMIILATIYVKNKDKDISELNYLQRVMVLTSLIIFIWYTARFSSLYSWIYNTSIGDLVSHYTRLNYNFLTLSNYVINFHGIYIFYIVSAFTVINILISKFKIKNTREFLSKNYHYIVLYSSTFIPSILYFTTIQITYRKIAPTVIILLIILLTYINQNINLRKIFFSVITLFLCAKIFFHYDNIYNVEENDKWWNYSKNIYSVGVIGSEFPRPVNTTETPYDIVIKKLILIKNTYDINNFALVLDDTAYPIEPYLLRLMCSNNSISCNFESPKIFNRSNTSYLEKYDALLIVNSNNIALEISPDISDTINKMLISGYTRGKHQQASPSELYSYLLHYLYSSNKLNLIGEKNTECFDLNKGYKACVIIRK